MQKIIATLCFPVTETEILLGLKKRGLGALKWNGFGGKVETGESIEDAARRETKEECGLEIISFEKRGVIQFKYLEEDKHIEGHIFCATSWRGKIEESEEMKPQWFNRNEIPYESMWLTDIHWLPTFLQGKRFTAELTFKNYDTLLEWSLKEG